MAKPRGWLEWNAEQARNWIRVPGPADDKYTRGVLGMRTGSKDYPGAAVLGAEAAARTGVGMVRYLGPGRASDLVLQRRPEVVTVAGRVQAWLLGSGINADTRGETVTRALDAALAEGLPTVVDAGALDRVAGGSDSPRPIVITPHYRELAALVNGRNGTTKTVTAGQIAADPGEWATRAARNLGVTVLLKGSVTRIATPSGVRLTVSNATAWLATAGSGDVLGGILGALLATNAGRIEADPDALAALAATAALVHARAAGIASAGGPLAALDVAEAVPAVIRALLAVPTERKH
ncbi:ADP-dependent NAD(P)H-hydrate dehydratase [Cryobacterium psychrophilum]|uniref:ADP-dependent (S)-NAD(P)H-hydrate dehydratase n=1 Tax=Cryobacterium psychrophilum TaxID=41988 RepID=A0A4Y8KKT3_9MICO|nr:ADP/ATP-dependent (S)-NAD(P)H-hydrate dehydratase [Cryobacterium psychrophilum]TDW30766.1 hydroxyethylthiazole kinase-like uncharacterized protein yjeF [Cryobacterium psychrophilum]TFD75832.1 NAD(P)H-hydrate dehydratase [Cryobacterium psychrophilum]